MITVVDYGMGNLYSVVKALRLYTETEVTVSSDPSSLRKSRAVVMPGDGAFAMAMSNLEKGGWIEPLKEYISSDGYFLGICLGYQLLFDSSEEFGLHSGLGIVPGRVVRFPDDNLKVPHMGWNRVEFRKNSPFLEGIDPGSYFYFIHSYYPVIGDESWLVGEAEYGLKFGCVIGKGNLFASQFHPEKSHSAGLKIIENFVRISC